MKAATLALAALATGSAQTPRDPIAFVACPIYRDTDAGAKSGCWLADDPATGIRYDVSASPTKPDWNHAILVEGQRGESNANPCGGVAMAPVRVAVLKAPCTRFMLEAEGYPGRRFGLPPRNVRPLYEERARPDRPFQPKTFAIPFDFDRHFVIYQLSDYYLDATINYALDVAPARITVTGYAQTDPIEVSGQALAEPASLARARAELVVKALEMRGVPSDAITLATGAPGESADPAFDGLHGPSMRRVEIRIAPQPAR